MIQNPGFLLDHFQNWITGSFCHSRHALKISERSFQNFLSYLANTQTDKQTSKQTKSGKNITALAEVMNTIWLDLLKLILCNEDCFSSHLKQEKQRRLRFTATQRDSGKDGFNQTSSQWQTWTICIQPMTNVKLQHNITYYNTIQYTTKRSTMP